MARMAWIDTHRGNVTRWEVDHVDHFTVAYYFQRFEDATLVMLGALGLDPASPGGHGGRVVTTHAHVRYLKEMRVGDILHVESGVTGEDGDAFLIGHKMFNSGDGVLTTTVEQRLAVVDTDRRRPVAHGAAARMAAHRVSWDVPDAARPDARSTEPPPVDDARCIDSALEPVKPWEVNLHGQADLPAFVHRFSAANSHLLAAFGVTPAYMREARRGFSTFEFRLAFPGVLGAGEVARVRSGLVHVGTTSMSFVHRMTRGNTGHLVATLQQSGVLLDLEARRPTPMTDSMRERARNLVATSRPAPAGA